MFASDYYRAGLCRWQSALVMKKPLAKAGDIRDTGSIRRRAWQPTPVFLPAESHIQRGLAGYSP